jgi:hypothetical protein
MVLLLLVLLKISPVGRNDKIVGSSNFAKDSCDIFPGFGTRCLLSVMAPLNLPVTLHNRSRCPTRADTPPLPQPCRV